MRSFLLSLTAALALAACGADDATGSCSGSSGAMCPGSDCTSCHGFRAAGTVFDGASSAAPVASATVTLVDKNGATVTRTTNSAGNFYTSTTLVLPLQRVIVTKGAATVEMLDVASGACNGCHGEGFRIHLP